MTTTLEWHRAGDELPTLDRDVLVVFDGWAERRAELCRYAAGDKGRVGEFYRADRWWPLDSLGASQVVKPGDVWAYVTIPERTEAAAEELEAVGQ